MRDKNTLGFNGDLTLVRLAQGVASFMEYKCVEAVFPEMNGAALFQLSVTPMGAGCSVLVSQP